MSELVPANSHANSVALRRQEKRLTSHHFEMGTLLGHQTPFELSEEHLSTHSCVLGATGSGKSKFLELLMRYLIIARRGFALIDPHGDLSEDLLAYAGHLKASKRESGIVDRIHYLEPSFERAFSFDPFRFRPTKPIPAEFQDNAYSAWLRAKADRVAEIFQRKQNQPNFEGMPRLQRVLTDVLLAVGTNVSGDVSEHLPLGDAMVLLDFTDLARHGQVFNRIRPYLEPEIVADFDRLSSYRNEEHRLRETESTINRLRSLFSPIVKAIFSQQAESIDFRSIVQNGEILLVNLRETDYFSADQRRALGGLFIHEILATAQNEDRENRKPFHLFIDEAADFIGDDVQNALGVMRKFKLSICLAAQDLSSFKKGELDLRAKVLSQCGTKVCFTQSWPDDLDVLSRVLATGNLKFDKHFQIVDRPDGYDWHRVEERSESKSTAKNWNKGQSTQSSSTTSQQETQSRSATTSDSQSQSTNSSHGESRTKSEDPQKRDHVVNHESTGVGHSRMHGNSYTDGASSSSGIATTRGKGESSSDGGSESASESISHKVIPLARSREEHHEQPSLKNAISDQLERIKQAIHSLGVGEAVVKLRNEDEAVIIKTHHVQEYWPHEKFEAIARMKQLCQNKPYFSVPDFTRKASEARIAEFVAGDTTPDHPAAGQKNGIDGPFGA